MRAFSFVKKELTNIVHYAHGDDGPRVMFDLNLTTFRRSVLVHRPQVAGIIADFVDADVDWGRRGRPRRRGT